MLQIRLSGVSTTAYALPASSMVGLPTTVNANAFKSGYCIGLTKRAKEHGLENKKRRKGILATSYLMALDHVANSMT